MPLDPSNPRRPFVETLLKDTGYGFLVGVFGSACHSVKHDVHALAENVPRVCWSAAVCFGLFSAIDHAMVSMRGKEEPLLDCAVAAAGASAITALPRGLCHAGAFALIGGAVGGVALGGLRFMKMEAGDRRHGDAARRGP